MLTRLEIHIKQESREIQETRALYIPRALNPELNTITKSINLRES